MRKSKLQKTRKSIFSNSKNFFRSGKKAQLQMMENTFVLLILFIIFMIVFLVILVVNKAQSNNRIAELQEAELIKKSQVLNFLPEMQCSDNNNLDPDCYDIIKIQTFRDYIEQDRTYYNSLLGHIRIEIEKYDPSPDINQELDRWEVYDYPYSEDKGVKAIQFPVLLRDVVDNSDYFGIIYLKIYK